MQYSELPIGALSEMCWLSELLRGMKRGLNSMHSSFLRLMLNPSARPCDLIIFKPLSTEVDLPASDPSSKYQAWCDTSAHSSSAMNRGHCLLKNKSKQKGPSRSPC